MLIAISVLSVVITLMLVWLGFITMSLDALSQDVIRLLKRIQAVRGEHDQEVWCQGQKFKPEEPKS